jgi:transcription initiation factor TFIIIB Brf1 subunit/transcription initiation factor TFIIB
MNPYVYLEKCSRCNNKDVTPEFDGGQLVCQQCGIVGETTQYTEEDIDEIAELLQATSVKTQEKEEELPKEIADMLREYELKNNNNSLEQLIKNMTLGTSYQPPGRKKYER